MSQQDSNVTHLRISVVGDEVAESRVARELSELQKSLRREGGVSEVTFGTKTSGMTDAMSGSLPDLMTLAVSFVPSATTAVMAAIQLWQSNRSSSKVVMEWVDNNGITWTGTFSSVEEGRIFRKEVLSRDSVDLSIDDLKDGEDSAQLIAK